MDNGLSASDVALMSGNGWGNGADSFMWIFALLVLAGGGFGNGWGNNGFANAIGYENLATSNEVQRGFDNQNSMGNQREILSAVHDGTSQAVAATNQAKYDNINVAKDIQTQIQSQIGEIKVAQAQALANQNACCCETKQLIQATSAQTDANIAQSKYDTSMALAGLEQRLTSKLDQNKIEALQDKIDELQLAQATNGILRYPTQATYSSPMPWWANNFGCGCGMNNI